jgi:hypothetical protein
MDTRNVMVGVPDLSTSPAPFYANIAHVSFTPYDFRITFSLLMTPYENEGSASITPPRAVAEVVLPAAAIDSFADILRDQLDRFTREFGRPEPRLRQTA